MVLFVEDITVTSSFLFAEAEQAESGTPAVKSTILWLEKPKQVYL